MKTKTLSMLTIFFLSLLLFLLSQQSHSATILVDGVSEWKNPSVHVGDTIIFKHKFNFNLYIFKNKKAFNLCNFTQSTFLTMLNSFSSFTWYPSRPGFFFFAFNNGFLQTCEASQKLTVKVSTVSSTAATPNPSPELSPMAAPTQASGGGGGGDDVSSSPAYPWPFRPRQEAAAAASSPGHAPVSAANSPVTLPSLLPDKGEGIPFINSNPAVPLPTGEVDSATIRPLPVSGHGRQVEVALALLASKMVFLFSTIFLML